MEALNETRQRLLDSLADTTRHVDILSTDLEPLLLDDELVTSAITRLVRRGARSRIRLLVSRLDTNIIGSHALVLLAKRLTSAMELRVLDDHPEWPSATWVICDQAAGVVVHTRNRLSRPVSGRAEAKAMTEQFERLWQSAQHSPEMRQF